MPRTFEKWAVWSENRPQPTTTSSLHVVEHGQIEIANDDIRSDPSACLSADSCCHVLQQKSTTTQHLRDTQTGGGQGSQGDGHISVKEQ